MGLYIITIVSSMSLAYFGTKTTEILARKRTTAWWTVMAWAGVTCFLPAGALFTVFWQPVWRFFAERPEAYESAGAAGAGGVAIFGAVLLVVASFGFVSLLSLAKRTRANSWRRTKRR